MPDVNRNPLAKDVELELTLRQTGEIILNR